MACIACSGANEEDAPFVAWQEAAEKCLPEHGGTIVEALSLHTPPAKPMTDLPASVAAARRSSQDPSNKARRISKQNADKVIKSACMAWETPFYVLAVGRGSPSGLRPDVVAGLLALLVGHKPTDMNRTQAALLSLARIFAARKDRLISDRICSIWENHENYDVRKDALLAIFLLGNQDVMRYTFSMRDLLVSTSSGQQATSLWSFCADQSLNPEVQKKLDWKKIQQILTGDSQDNTITFAFIRLRNCPQYELEAMVKPEQLFEVVVKNVLKNAHSRRLVLQAAFCFIFAHKALVA
jgi:hypothetical protein